MTTTSPLVMRYAPEPLVPSEPFFYGWRYVQRELPDGSIVTDEVPLTLEDVLYPQEGDQVTHNQQHQRTVRYLVNVLEARLAHNTSAAVLDDVLIAWDEPGLRPNGPDIAVVFGVSEHRNWSTFDVVEEGVKPELLIEVTSPETRGIDIVTKADIYAQAGIPYYIIVDLRQWKGRHTVQVLGYQLGENGYDVLPPDARGMLWLEPVKLWLGIENNIIFCYDASGSRIGDYAAVDAALAQAETRA